MSNAFRFALLLLGEIVPLAMRGIPAAVKALEEGRGAVLKMIQEGRDPTTEEWAALNAGLVELREKFHGDAA